MDDLEQGENRRFPNVWSKKFPTTRKPDKPKPGRRTIWSNKEKEKFLTLGCTCKLDGVCVCVCKFVCIQTDRFRQLKIQKRTRAESPTSF